MRRFPTSLLCTAVLLLGAAACSDDDDASSSDESSTTAGDDGGSTTLAKGEDVELVGDVNLAGQTLNIDAEEQDGEATGEFWVSDVVTRVDCANTDTDGVVVLAGEVTAGAPGFIEEGSLLALVIREGDPDGVSLVGNDANADSCTGLLESVPEDLFAEDADLVLVEAPSDIQTG